MADYTKKIRIGDKYIGAGEPILIQSMCNTDTRNVSATVEQIKRNVPSSGGLGTSAICIIAGMKIAGHLLNIKEFELVNHMINFEGHPDNILPAVYGGLISTFKDNDKF